MIALYIALAALTLGILIGRIVARRIWRVPTRDDWMDVANAVQTSDTPIAEQVRLDLARSRRRALQVVADINRMERE